MYYGKSKFYQKETELSPDRDYMNVLLKCLVNFTQFENGS